MVSRPIVVYPIVVIWVEKSIYLKYRVVNKLEAFAGFFI